MTIAAAFLLSAPSGACAQDIDSKYAASLIAEGSTAPDFSLSTPQGKRIRLSSLRGKYTVIDFQASWCPDCRRDIPEMKRIYSEFHPLGVEFIGVSFDTDRAAWSKMIKDSDIAWPQVSELKKWKETKVSKDYGVNWIPSMVLTDPEGKVVLRTVMTSKLEKRLTELTSCNRKPETVTLDTMINGSKGRLALTLERPEAAKERIPVAIIMHGFMGNRNEGLLRLISDSLLARGFATVRFDFDGHGSSEGKFEDMTVPSETDDALKVLSWVKSLPFAGKTALVGHSQGGVVAGMAAGEAGKGNVNAVVLLAPAAVLRDDAIRGNNLGAVYDPLDPPESVALPGGKRLGRGYILSALTLPIYETSALFSGYAAIIHGTGDRTVPYTYGERYHSIWKGSKLHLLPGYDHGFSQNPYRAAALIAAFLSARLKP